MSLFELTDGQILNFPRRLFETFTQFAYRHSKQSCFAAEIEHIYLVNWQVICINEIPRSLHREFIDMLEQFEAAISDDPKITDVRTAGKLVNTVLKDLKRHGHA